MSPVGKRFKPTKKELQEALRGSWSKATTYDPKIWSKENPAWGQCAPTALVVQNYLGGNLKVRFIKGIGWHYWNQLPDGTEIDFTKEQFGKKKINFLPGEITDRNCVLREFLLSYRQTIERYQILERGIHEYFYFIFPHKSGGGEK